jgi:hypothetical protein
VLADSGYASEANFARANGSGCLCFWPKAGQQVRCKMALVSLVAVASMLTAWAVSTITSSTHGGGPACGLRPAPAARPSAPLPITSRRHRQGMSSAADSGCGRRHRGLAGSALLALADLPAVDDQVVVISHAINRTEPKQ